MKTANLETAQQRLGYVFRDPSLLSLALVHASTTDRRHESNERLEFLGDAVLGLVCCEQVYQLYPDLLEGEMTKIKSTVVSRQTCAALAREMGLDGLLSLGKGMLGHKVLPQSLAAGTFEAVIAAMYQDGGIEPVREFLRPRLEPLIRRAAASGHQENYKSVLQQFSQQRFQTSPQYVILDEKGPDHSKCFELCVDIAGRRFPSCWGASKKAAEQQAALNALQELGVLSPDNNGGVKVIATDLAK